MSPTVCTSSARAASPYVDEGKSINLLGVKLNHDHFGLHLDYLSLYVSTISPVDILQHEEWGADEAGDKVAEGQVQYVHVR